MQTAVRAEEVAVVGGEDDDGVARRKRVASSADSTVAEVAVHVGMQAIIEAIVVVAGEARAA